MKIRDVSKAIIFDTQNRLILQRRDDNPDIDQPGLLTLFGGQVESGETATVAIIRELEEEIGIAFAESSLRHVLSKQVMNGSEVINVHYFRVLVHLDYQHLKVYEGTPESIELAKIKQHQSTPLLDCAVRHILRPKKEKQYQS